MILLAEMTWAGTEHAAANAAIIEVVARAFPTETVRVLGERSHLDELRRATTAAGVEFRPVVISPLFHGKTHVVSLRRFVREITTLRAALRGAPRARTCLLMLLSATPTAIVAASLLRRLARRPIGVAVVLHGNLNEIAGWRPRNPFTRRFDLRSVLATAASSGLRFLVLEPAVRDALARLAPALAARTDVLPHPVLPAEIAGQATVALGQKLRIGFVGRATQAKGFDIFLDLARDFTTRYSERASFHLVGSTMPGADRAALAVLADAPGAEQLPRAEFVARLERLHYVLLPFRPGYYDLSASGALLDAVTWLKPVIAADIPLARQFFAAGGDIGCLCAGPEAMREAIETVLLNMDPARYRAQAEALRRLRDSRHPRALAAVFRTIVNRGFPDLLP